MKTIDHPAAEEHVDHFDLFENFCRAAQIPSGVARISVFLALPDEVQADLWRDISVRVAPSTEGDS